MKIFKTCKGCSAICCKYITIELKTPKTKKDLNKLKTYLTHKKIQIQIEEDGSWWIKFYTPCQHLNKNNLCNIYKNRPKTCKEHKKKNCERYNKEDFILTFKEPEEINDYIKNIFDKNKHHVTINS